MPKPHQIIERHWQHPRLPLTLLLWPLSRVFQTASALRCRLYRTGRLKSEKLPVPVVVVGNIHAGGTGKTPIVAALVKGLQAQGLKTGIVSRGYGRQDGGVRVLGAGDTAAQAGDEPLMLHRQTAAPAAVGRRRAEAARALLAAHPDLDVIVADDGLQHYALARDIEIAVFPAADLGRTNLDLLPNGGLREPVSRLKSADFVIVSGGTDAASAAAQLGLPPEKVFFSTLENGAVYRLSRPAETWDAGRLKNTKTAALAGIARPERFFQSLRDAGIRPGQTVALPDHARLTAADLPEAEAVFITEKDAVKLAAAPVPENVWVLPVRAIIRPDLAAELAGRLKNLSAQKKDET